MKLVIDVGNSETMLGQVAGGTIERVWERRTRPGETADELYERLESLAGSLEEYSEILVASVVPGETSALEKLAKKRLGKNIWFLRSPWKEAKIELAIKAPEKTGADRVAGAEALYHIYGAGFVIDFGTATTVEAVDPEANYLGGVILPGIEPSARGLSSAAANLSDFFPCKPEEFKCRETEEALHTGIFYGTGGAVEHILEKLREEFSLGTDLPVVATGGWAEDMLDLTECITDFEPYLVLKGLLACHSKKI